jgi:hypothetical protein
VTNDFTNNVAIEDAHDEKGQCNMGRESEVRGRQLIADSLQRTVKSEGLWAVSCLLWVSTLEKQEL